jgi:hypothetical protein
MLSAREDAQTDRLPDSLLVPVSLEGSAHLPRAGTGRITQASCAAVSPASFCRASPKGLDNLEAGPMEDEGVATASVHELLDTSLMIP